MGLLDGIKQLLLRTGEPTGADPSAGRIFKWVEKAGNEFIYKYKDENGVVGNIGSSGVLPSFKWMLQGGWKDLPSNGTERFSYGRNEGDRGVTVMHDGFVKGLSVRIKGSRNSGSATFLICLNNSLNNVAGQRVIIDGSTNAEGGIDGEKGYFIFSPPLAYSAGDQLEIKAVTSGWSPTSADGMALAYMEDTI